MESAWTVLGDEEAEDDAESEGAMIDLNPLLLFGLDCDLEYDCCVTNFGCE